MKRITSLAALILMLALLTSCTAFENETTASLTLDAGWCGTTYEPHKTAEPVNSTTFTGVNDSTVLFKFYEHDLEAHANCHPGSVEAIRTELVEGARDCTGGAVTEYQCTSCAYGYTMLTNSGHPVVKEDLGIASILAEDGATPHNHYGYSMHCACGKTNNISVNFPSSGKKFIEGIEYTTCKFSGCDLRAGTTDIVHVNPDKNCVYETKAVYRIFYGDKLIAEAPVELPDAELHDWEEQFALAPWTETCDYGGVIVTRDCKRCGKHEVERPSEGARHVAEKQYIPLGDEPNVCAHHEIYHSLCLCKEQERVFNVGYDLHETYENPNFYSCVDCDLTVTVEHDHDKVTDICNTENCFKFTIRAGDKIIAEHRSPKSIITKIHRWISLN